MNLFFSVCVSLLLLCCSFFSYSVEVDNLYSAEVVIEEKSAQGEYRALQRAMSAVLLKVGGQEKVLTNPVIKKALKKVKSYYQQSKYIRVDKQQFLSVTFDENKVNALFIKANLPLWGSFRPSILTFLVFENGLTRQLLIKDSQAIHDLDYQKQIDEFSQERGLPFVLPSQENEHITSDIWGRFFAPLNSAATTYKSEAVVVLRLSNSSLLPKSQETLSCQVCEKNNFALDWTFISDSNNPYSLSFGDKYESTEPSELVRRALKEITQTVYDKYASKTTENQELVINVANINTLVEYSQVRTFLESISSVVSVTLEKIQGSEKFFRVALIGEPRTFLKTLELNQELQQYIDPLATEVSAIPVFYWRKL